MELRPTVKSGTLSIGCQIKGWKNEPLVENLVPNSQVLAVDGVNTETLPFVEVVERIRSSANRLILLQPPFVLSKGKGLNIAQDIENTHPNVSSSSMGDFVDMKSTVSGSPSPNISQNTANEIFLLKEEVIKAKQEVTDFKIEKRVNEGKLMFLKFQLDKLKGAHNNSENVAPNNNPEIVSAESVQWLKHWNKYKPALDCIKLPTPAVPQPVAVPVYSEKEGKLKKDLYTQERLSFRLEMQLRTWVDSQINLQKTLAAQESDKYFEMKEKYRSECSSRGAEVADTAVNTTDSVEISESVETAVLDTPVARVTNTPSSTSTYRQSPPGTTQSTCSILTDRDTIVSITKPQPAPAHEQVRREPKELYASEKSEYIVNQRRSQWDSFACSPAPLPITTQQSANITAAGAIATPIATIRTSKQKSPENALSPQQYRTILSSIKKPPNPSREVLAPSTASTGAAQSIQQNSNADVYRSNYQQSTGYYTREHNTRESSSYSTFNYSRPQAPRSYQEQSGVTFQSKSQPRTSTFTRTSSINEQQNSKSRALKERMLKLKQESEKIRDDLRRFRSTMQDVRDECA